MGLIFIPILGLLFSIFSRYLGKKNASIMLIMSIIITFLYASYFIIEIFNGTTYLYKFTWMEFSNLSLSFQTLIDPLSLAMSLLITFITSLVMIYSYSYLNQDPGIIRFLSFFVLFDLCMLIMVTAGNYVQFFLGWEMVGLTSYLLISFWHTRNEANKGALKAVVMNRIGDVFFMLALALIWVLFKSFDFSIIFNLYPEYLKNTNNFIFGYQINLPILLAFCLLIAACAKSAQFLLHTWLPDAMEGPTPVSSLLHSATMVTAGIYLIIRSSFIFSQTPTISLIMTILGILTALISGLIALNQYDLKRIIAYSTCSQLGFMTLACGLGYYNYAFFHLTTHAFFKCLLFLCSGSIIHALNDEQDIRKMGNLFHYLPITFICMTIGTLALTGFPFLAGYYSKDLILETAYISSQFGKIIFILAIFAAFLTSFYSMRSLYLVFFRQSASFAKPIIYNITESSFLMLIPIIILTILAIISGYFLQPLFTGPINLIIWQNSIATPIMSSLTEHEYLSYYTKILPTIFSLLGLISSYIFFSTTTFYSSYLFYYYFINITSQKFYIDQIFNYFIAKSTTSFGYLQYTLFDRGYLEKFGPYGLTQLILFLMRFNKLNLKGFITHYLLISFLLLILYYFIFLFNLNVSLAFIFITIIFLV